MTEQKFEWKCPRQHCVKEIIAYTERGMRLLAEEHIYKHIREDREKAANMLEGKQEQTAMTIYEPKDYDILKLTRSDIGFLRTRGIAIDDNIVIEEQ